MQLSQIFLIKFQHHVYCQGTRDNVTDTVLVYANDYDKAVDKIKDDYRFDNPHSFENMTI